MYKEEHKAPKCDNCGNVMKLKSAEGYGGSTVWFQCPVNNCRNVLEIQY